MVDFEIFERLDFLSTNDMVIPRYIDDLGFSAVYSSRIYSRTSALANKFFPNTIKNGKLTASIFLAYFSEEKHWNPMCVDFIKPSVEGYFSLFNHNKNPMDQASEVFILPIESLTLKFEGLIRHLVKKHGYNIYFRPPDSLDYREKDLNLLLNDATLEKFMDSDDIAFLKFVLTEKDGYNLRNKIAHALMSSNEYSPTYMHLLLLALLRISKYK